MTRLWDRPGWGGGRASGWLLMVVLCAAPGFALAGEGPSGAKHARIELEGMAREWRSAQLAGDAATMDRMLADDYVGMTMQGQVTTKAQQLRRMRERRTVVRRMDLSGVKVQLEGEVAVITMRARVVGSGTAGPVNGCFRCRQIFHRLPGGRWTMTNFEVAPIGGRGRARAS